MDHLSVTVGRGIHVGSDDLKNAIAEVEAKPHFE